MAQSRDSLLGVAGGGIMGFCVSLIPLMMPEKMDELTALLSEKFSQETVDASLPALLVLSHLICTAAGAGAGLLAGKLVQTCRSRLFSAAENHEKIIAKAQDDEEKMLLVTPRPAATS